jgi:hypothetical protein
MVFPPEKSISMPYFPINTNSNVSFISNIPHSIIRLPLLTKAKKQHARHNVSPFRFCHFQAYCFLYILYTDSYNTDYLPKSSIIFLSIPILFTTQFQSNSNPFSSKILTPFQTGFDSILTPFDSIFAPKLMIFYDNLQHSQISAKPINTVVLKVFLKVHMV